MTQTPRRGIRRNSPRQQALQALTDAGGSMLYDDFRRVLAGLYTSKNAIDTAMAALCREGNVQRRIHLTASGSARLEKTAGEP